MPWDIGSVLTWYPSGEAQLIFYITWLECTAKNYLIVKIRLFFFVIVKYYELKFLILIELHHHATDTEIPFLFSVFFQKINHTLV